MKCLGIRFNQLVLSLCKDMKSNNKGSFYTMFTIVLWMLLASVQVSYSVPSDSLRTKWIDGKKYFLHKVIAKDTWTSVAKKNNISIDDLEKANKGVSVLKIGQIIQVPAVGSANEKEKSKAAIVANEKSEVKSVKQTQGSSNEKILFHVVAKGETLYRISKDNSITVDELKKLNNLTSNNVSLGQKLIIGRTKNLREVVRQPIEESPIVQKQVSEKIEKADPEIKTKKEEVVPEIKKEVKVVVEAETTMTTKQEPIKSLKVDSPSVYTNLGNSSSSSIEKDAKTGVTTEKITQSGLATWITDGELNQNKFYAMHRTAPIGTIIKITNKMNNNSVFVKVVGLLPDTGDNANVIIKITQAAAQRIGALDQRFQAELSYGITK